MVGSAVDTIVWSRAASSMPAGRRADRDDDAAVHEHLLGVDGGRRAPPHGQLVHTVRGVLRRCVRIVHITGFLARHADLP